MNDNMYYLNRIIKVISPLTFQTFKVELNGEENELRELLATILEINPHSIKGLRDSYNNYYTLSSAVKNPHINTNPYNYYTVIIKNTSALNIKNTSLVKSPSYNYNLLKHDRIYSMQNDNSINYHNNFLNNTYNFYEDNNLNYKNNDVSDFLSFADDLYKKNYIDYNLVRKLKRLIRENNEEVLNLMSPFINLKSHKSYDEFTKRIMPVISSRSPIFENNEESNEDSSSLSNNDKNKKNKTGKLTKEAKILEDVKINFSKEKYNKLKKLLKKKNKKIIKIIKNYEKNKEYNLLISKLSRLINELEEENEDEDEDSSNKINSESGNGSDEGKSQKSKKKKKDKSKLKEKDIKKITKNIINSLKDKGIDIYYTSKFDLQRLNDDEKLSLFTKKFKLPIDSILSSNKIPKKSISSIKNYYQQFISKKITKNFDENENIVYESLLKQEEENNIIIKCYKDLLKHKNISELRSQIKEIIKETIEGIEEEEGEEEEDDEDEESNQGKNFIKEENEEEKDDDDEEEEEEGDEDEESEKDEDNENSSNKSSDNIIILKDDNKDRGVDLLNNNYRKINNYNFNNSKNDEKEKKESEKEKKNNDEQNLGLGFVVVKQKKKDDSGNDSNKNNNILKLNTTDSKQNESSLSTNNPNKKLNQFIQQIEHMKKIDDIKKTIIDAINSNNKYIMELFQKFQKNKFSLNPKALYTIHKQIKENPDSNGKDSNFKLLVKEVPNINENIQEFLCNEFNNKNSELETYYNLYEEIKEKDDFFESIEMFMKKPGTKKLLTKFTLNRINEGVFLNLLKKDDNLINKSKEFVKAIQKYNLFNEKESNVILNSLENNDSVFTGAFQALFNAFYLCLSNGADYAPYRSYADRHGNSYGSHFMQHLRS